MSAAAHTDLQSALDAERAQRIALQHHAADQAQRVADLEAEIERITEAGRAHIRRAAAFEAQRDALAARLAEIEAQGPVAWIEHELQGTGLRHLHFKRRPNTLRDDVVAPVWTELIARPAPVQAAAPEQAERANDAIARAEGAESAAAPPSERNVSSIPDADLLRRVLRNVVQRRPRRCEFAWAAVSGAFGLGSTYSAQLLRRFDLDPDTGVELAQARKNGGAA